MFFKRKSKKDKIKEEVKVVEVAKDEVAKEETAQEQVEKKQYTLEDFNLVFDDEKSKDDVLEPSQVDEDRKRALRVAIERKSVSNTLLRAQLGFGYNKAAAIILWMEKMGYVSTRDDNKTFREVYITKEKYEEIFGEYVIDW